MIRKYPVGNLPLALKRVADTFKESIDVYECDKVEDILDAARDFPLELFMIAQTDKNDVIERYFMVGLALPTMADTFKDPLLYFVHVKSENYNKINTFVTKYNTDKSAIWNPDSQIVH